MGISRNSPNMSRNSWEITTTANGCTRPWDIGRRRTLSGTWRLCQVRLPARRPSSVSPSLIDGCGGVGGERAIGRAEASRSRRAGAQPVLGRIYQRSAVCRQASLGMQEFDPGSVRAAGPATLRFLIGEAGEPTQMAPVDAGRIASIDTRQLSANFGGQGRLERSGADVDPGLEISGAGLQHPNRP